MFVRDNTCHIAATTIDVDERVSQLYTAHKNFKDTLVNVAQYTMQIAKRNRISHVSHFAARNRTFRISRREIGHFAFR
eukprot:COSAG02_NODE_27735_length_603_cov_1.700397_1_plen_77_part_10